MPVHPPLSQPESFVRQDTLLAEGPLWRDGFLYWTDIPLGRIYKCDTQTRKVSVLYEGPKVGGFTLQEDGSLLLFRIDDIIQISSAGKQIARKKVVFDGSLRFNDVIADPKGRVFAGTIGKTSESGGLFLLNLDGSFKELFKGTGCSNGMGFSPDLKTFYWTCSSKSKIDQFDYHLESGNLSNRRTFYQATPEEGITDGLTVDASGNVWSARWAGGAIFYHSPSGAILQKIKFPETNITSICFGDPSLESLYVTVAYGEEMKDMQNGTGIYKVTGVPKGKPEFCSKVKL